MDSKANADVRKMAVRANRSSVSLNTDQLYEPFPYARSNAVAKSALNVTKPSDPDPAPPALPPANHKGGATRLPVQLGCVTSKLPSVSMLSCDCPAVMSTSAAATANQFSLYTDRMTHQMLTSQSIGSHSSGDQSTDQLLTPALYLRERWLNRLQFLCTCVGHSTALGNLWRFPWMCYRHGGGSFVFAYLITAFSVAMPLLMIELSLGQYAAMNPIHLFQHLTPILQGTLNSCAHFD